MNGEVLSPQVRAAGGVLWRPGHGGHEILLIHRPRYNDWSFPKGKANPGEHDRECAMREVEEETGYRARPGHELTPVHYIDSKLRLKRVRYWVMTVIGGDGRLAHETDESRWLGQEEARNLLTYNLDRHVLAEALTYLERSQP